MMSYVHPLMLSEMLNTPDDEAIAGTRLALAGGSDERPPEDEPPPAQVIRFPVERVRRGRDDAEAGDEAKEHPLAPAPEAAADDPSLWPAWMSRVLTRRYGPPSGDGHSSSPGLTA